MRLDELFSRKSGVSTWTKTGGNLIIDRGQDGFAGFCSSEIVNKLRVREDDEEEASQS